MPAVRAAFASFMRAMRNPGIRRLELSWMAATAADSGLLVALLVVAYTRDGVVAAALLGAFRMVPAVVAGAGAGAALRRWSGPRILVTVAGVRVAVALATAAAIVVSAPTWVLFGLVMGAGASGALVRPIQATLMPALARTPEELVAANVAWGSVEGIGTLVGPAIAAGLIASGQPAGVAVAAAAGFAVTGLAVVGVRFEQAADTVADRADGGRIRLVDGLRVIGRRPALRWMLTDIFGQTLTRGLLNAFVVVASVELLGLGDPGVGTLNAAIGVGGLLGGVVAMSLRPANLVRAETVALAFWGLPIAVVALVPEPAVALAAMAVIGLANATFDVAVLTIFQRGSSNEERGAAFALFETAAGLGVVAGSVLAPVLLAAFGDRGGLAAGGAILPVLAMITYARVGRLTDISSVDESVVDLLRRVPAFAVLPLTAVERLARATTEVRFAPGDVLMRQGEPGDRFLVLVQGEVEVRVDGRPIARLGPGEGVGEIALLRRSPRTATVTALTDVVCWAIGSADFCAAASGPTAAVLMEQLIRRRLERIASST